MHVPFLRPAILTLPLLIAPLCPAQSPSPTPTFAVPTLQERANLVVVDLVVTDRAGNPVPGMTAADLALTDDGKPQTLHSFELHTASSTPVTLPIPARADLPVGTFSNAQASPTAAPVLNILLLDTLNTPLTDQTFVHQQTLQFLRSSSPGPIAIFGLTNHLIPLQGFTSDPRLLRAAIDRLGSRASNVREDNVSTASQVKLSDTFETSLGGSDREFAAVLTRLRQFEADIEISQDRMRQHMTLDALDALANYLVHLPGRKNLIWFSGAFALDVLPDTRQKTAFPNTGNDVVDQLRETSALLARAQVALYPVDARGLFNVPTYDPGARSLLDPASLARQTQLSNQQVADQHEVMRTMADETGGHAFLNTNGLARAVNQAIGLGSTFYTLTYTPTPEEPRPSLHRIHLALTGRLAGTHLNLSYRRSYYSTPALLRAGATGRRALTSGGTALELPVDENAFRLAMIHDAPEIAAIPFTAEVRPVSSTPAPQPDANTHPNAALGHGPWRTYTVSLTLPAAALVAPAPTAGFTGTVQFALHCYNADGQLLSSTSDAVRMNLPASVAPRIETANIPFGQRISVPQTANDVFLRIGVQNLATGAVGSLELPLAVVNNLPPAASSPNPPPSPALAHP